MKIFSLFGTVAINGMDTINKSLKEFDRDMRATTNTINKFGANLSVIGKKITLATAPLAAAGVAAIKFGADFDLAMTNSLAIMGDVSDAMKKDMSDAARKMAKESTFSAREVAEAYYFLAAAGLDAKQSLASIPLVTKFAQAGNFNLALATDLLTDAQAALGLQVKDTAENMANMVRVSDVLVKANTIANASVQQFSESLTNKAGMALRQLGKDVEEGVAVLAVFAGQGLKGEEAGEALNIVMRDLQTRGIKNKDVFDRLGVSVFNSSGEMRNMADVIGDMETLFQGMSDEQRRSTLITMGFQDRSISAMMALIGFSDSIRNYETQLRSAGGLTDEVSKKQLEAFSNKVKLIKNRLVDMAITIGEKLLPVIESSMLPVLGRVMSVIEALLAKFSGLPPVVQKIIFAVSALAVATGPALVAIGFMIPAVHGLSIALVKLFGIMLANPIGLIVAGTVALAAAVGYATFKLHQEVKAIEKVKEAFDKMPQAAQRSAGMAKAASEARVKALEKEHQRTNEIESQKLANKKLMAEEQWKIDEDLAKERKSLMSDYADRLFDLEHDEIESLERRRQKELENARTVKAALTDIAMINRTFDLERAEIEKRNAKDEKTKLDETTDARTKSERQWVDAIDQQSGNRLAILEREKQDALGQENLTEDARKNIVKYYAREIEKIHKESAENSSKTFTETLQWWGQVAGDYLGALTSLFTGGLDNQRQALDARYDAEKTQIDDNFNLQRDKINAMNVSDQERALLLEKLEADKAAKQIALDQEIADKKRAIARKQAIADKANALFSIGINTAVAISKVLYNPLMIALVAGLGALQAAAVIARPIPMKDGAYVEARNGGVLANIAEGGKPEIVFPLEKGVDVLSNMLIDKLGGVATRGPNEVLHSSVSNRSSVNHVEVNIGVFSGDARALKDLERQLKTVRLNENFREGE